MAVGLVWATSGCDPVVSVRRGPPSVEVEMDPVTLIVAALAAGAGAGVKETATHVVKDAYAGLKALVLRRVKDTPAGEVAVVEHAKDPEVWSAPLAKTLTAAGADQDADLLAAAQ